MIYIINSTLFLVASFVMLNLYRLYQRLDHSVLDRAKKIKLIFTGFIANVSDTLGIGSFAVVVALDKHWGLVDDKRLPGTLNGQSVLPSLLQSFLFLKFVEIDLTLLLTLTVAGCLGGFVGGILVARCDKQTIRKLMTLGFLGIAVLILANQMHLLPLAGEAISLSSDKLAIGFVAMVLVGMLPTIGVGLYAPTQVVLFLLGLSPLVAFPLMTSMGVIVQSSAALAFIQKETVAVKEVVYLTLSGLLGVLLAVPLVTIVHPVYLRWLLFVIVLYNAKMIWQSYKDGRELQKQSNSV